MFKQLKRFAKQTGHIVVRDYNISVI